MSTRPSYAYDEGSPAQALILAAQEIGVALDPEALHDRFDVHPARGSLKALVEIAAEHGIEARAFKADLPGLAETALPAIVHLARHGEQFGFGLLLERRPGQFVLDAGDGAGRRAVDETAFLRTWTGIVVTLAPGTAERAAGPRAGVLWRIGRMLRGSGTAPFWQDAARAVLVVAVLAGAFVAAARPGASGPWTAAAGFLALAVSGLGLFAGWALYYRARVTAVPGATPRLASTICGRGKHTDCSGVLASRYARVFGIDLSALGLALLGSPVVLAALGALLVPPPHAAVFAWLGVYFLLAAPCSLYFVAVQFWPLRRICPLCMTVHAVVLSCAVLGAVLLSRAGDWGVVARAAAPWAALHAVLIAGALGLVLPFLDLRIESRTSRARLGWIAATPWGALAEMIGRPRATRRTVEAAIRLGDPAAPFRLDAMIHPMCTGCGPVVDQLEALERAHRGTVTIAFHLPPRDTLSEADWGMCTAIAAIGAALGPAAALEAFRTSKKRPAEILAAAAGGAESALRYLRPGDADAVAPHVARARATVEEADRLADELQRGTPTLLLAGRPWEAPAEDLASLLAHDRALVARLLRIRLPETEPS